MARLVIDVLCPLFLVHVYSSKTTLSERTTFPDKGEQVLSFTVVRFPPKNKYLKDQLDLEFLLWNYIFQMTSA